MSRILFTTIPEKGHLNPMIGPAVWLRRRGHHVRFYASHDISSQLRAAGLESVGGMSENAPPPDINRGASFAQNVRNPSWLRTWIRRLLVEESAAAVPVLENVIRDFAPDVVVTDPMIYPAAIAAHRAGVPWVAMSNSLNPVLDDEVQSDLLDTVRWLAPARDALFAAHGMRANFRGCDVISPRLTIAFTTPEFVGREVPGVAMTGPSFPPGMRGDETAFPWEKLKTPAIFASFGSQIYHQPHLFRLLIETTRSSGFQLVVAVNELLHTEEFSRLPEHVIACHYAPQLALLPRMAAFVTHGGANSVMEALHFGVPLLISPVCNDQFHQAEFIRRANVGRVMDLHTSGVAEVREALAALVSDADIRSAIARVKHSYQVDGAARAADLIEELLKEECG